LDTYSDLPEVQTENRTYHPKEGQNFLRETLMPNDEVLSANGERTSFGMYQIDLFVPIDSSISEAENLADNLKELFKPAQNLSGVILEKSALLQSKVEKSWYIIPIRVSYRAHQLNT
jgi:hypothetical protein